MNLAFKKILAILLHATFALVASFSYVTLAHAATTTDASTTSSGSVAGFVPLTSLPGIQNAANATTLPVFLNEVYKICIGVAAVLAVLYIMYAGVEFMTSRGSVSSNENAKKHIQNAILGLILVLSPTIVFGIINPDILHLDLDVSQLTPSDNSISAQNLSNAGNGNSCYIYTAKKAVSQTSCDTGWTQAPNTCCSLTTTDQICCGQVGPTQYLLAYTFKKTPKTTGGEASCTELNTPRYFASKNDCDTALNSLSGFVAAGSEDYTYSNLQVLKSCVAVNDTSYKIPDATNACKN